MADRSPEEIAEIRRRMIEVEFRAKSDEDFRERLVRSPLEVLREFGLDEATTNEILPEFTGEATVSGAWCDGITCIITSCNFLTYNDPGPHHTIQ
jgi:hypothetical protein